MPVLFIWVALYGLTYALSEALFRAPAITALCMAAYCFLLLLWIIRSGQGRTLGLCRPSLSRRDRLWIYPLLLLLPLYNLLTSTPPALVSCLLLLSAALVEEVFFRGFLLSRLFRWGAWRSVWFSAVIFALFHGVNLLQGAGLLQTAAQIFCAAAAGILYAAVTLCSGSILPAMLSHALVNTTGNGASAVSPVLLFCAALQGICGFYIVKSKL